MPHKMNSRSCERIGGFLTILRGHLTMVAALAGDQWNEGDVSCSVVRRVALPDAFLAVDGLFETFLTVLDDFGDYPAVIERELDRYLPFLATSKVLVAAVRHGVGREQAHEVIKEHAVAAALRLREGADENDLLERLGADTRLGLDPGELADVALRAARLRRRRTGAGPLGGGEDRGRGGHRPCRCGLPSGRHPLSALEVP